MQCPQCGARTEVAEKRGTYRDRRCMNDDCHLEFTTREQILRSQQEFKPGQHGRLCARTRASLTDERSACRSAGESTGAARRSGSGAVKEANDGARRSQ